MLIFVLPTKKCLVAHFERFSNISTTHNELENTETTKNFVDAGVYF